ncbi:hypothetical protein [Streptomyces tendae]
MTGGATLAVGTGELATAPSLALPIVCLTAAAAGVIRRYFAAQERRARTLFTGLAREHAERQRELDRREAELVRREQALRRIRFTTELRIANVYGRLDQVLNERAVEHAELRVEYQELAREFNEICVESALTEPAEAQHPSPVAVGQLTAVRDGHGPRALPRRRGPRPFLTVVEDAEELQESG